LGTSPGVSIVEKENRVEKRKEQGAPEKDPLAPRQIKRAASARTGKAMGRLDA
jgi:hypothetical protein